MQKLAAEFTVILASILLALAVDEWRQEREELRIASEHLSDVAAELRSNLCTVERVRVRMLQRKIDDLQKVVRFLNDPEAPVEDPATLLQAFARSASAARPWLVDSQFQALQNSGHARLLRKLHPDLRLASTYEGPDVLFSQIERFQGTYPIVVNGLIPAQLQAKFSQLRGYVRDKHAPPIADDDNLLGAIEGIRARRTELLGLARNEAAVATAKWYAFERIKLNLEEALESLAPWDRATTSVAEDLVDCAAPKSSLISK